MSLEILATSYSHQKVVLSGNPVAVVVDSVDIINNNRDGLRYYLEILKPVGYLSGTFEVFRTLSGYETPPKLVDGGLIFEGWTVFIEDYLDALLKHEFPVFEDGMARHPLAMTRYRTRSWAERDGVLVAGSEVNSGINYVLKGSMSEDAFSVWKNDWWKSFEWLTNLPDGVVLPLNQPVYLSFIFNLLPLPTTVKLIAKRFRKNPTALMPIREERVQLWIYKINLCEVATFDVSAERIGYIPFEHEKVEIWLEDDNGYLISKKKTLRFTEEYSENPRDFLVCNGFGGWDAVRMMGVGQNEISVTKELGQRVLGSAYSTTDAEFFEVNKQGERVLKVSSGSVPKKLLSWFGELLWSQLIFVKEPIGWTSVLLKTASLATETDKEDVGERVFEFVGAKTERGFDLRVATTETTQRPTQWVASGPYCLVNEKGFQTGYLGASTLTLYYTDVSPYEKVQGVSLKQNLPGTDGYVPAVLSNVCVVGYSEETNVEISRQGTYTKQTCGNGYTGTTALITVAAGEFGGETVELANKLAEEEWQRRNTQAAADANVNGCVAQVEDYPYTVPSGMAHFRWNTMRIGTAYADNYVVSPVTTGGIKLGNAWFIGLDGNTSVYRFAAGTNDINLPITGYASGSWQFGFYIGGTARTVKVYQNGALINETSIAADVESGHSYFFLTMATFVNGDRVYIKIV